MIKLNDVEKYYTNKFIKTYVLRQINLEIEKGEFITIMGPSGAGKSTLLYILGMLDSPSEGKYYFYDEPVHKMSAKKLTELHKSHIGFVFQQYHLIDELTVYENIETPLLYQKIKGGERKGLVADILDRFNMVAKKDLFPNQLSGGQQQLVAIARAVIAKPKLILADEPTGNLDKATAEQVMKVMLRLNQEYGTSLVVVTHDMGLAQKMDVIYTIENGQLIPT